VLPGHPFQIDDYQCKVGATEGNAGRSTVAERSGTAGEQAGLECSAPVACTLGADEWTDRVAEWQRFRRTSVLGAAATDGVLRLRLQAADGAVTAAASLSRREKECCAFFDFAIEIEATGSTLVVRVPPGAEATLADFTAMLDAT
jgi:hypothetical protein